MVGVPVLSFLFVQIHVTLQLKQWLIFRVNSSAIGVLRGDLFLKWTVGSSKNNNWYFKSDNSMKAPIWLGGGVLIRTSY